MFNQVYSWIFLSKKSSTGHLSSRCRIIIARKSDFQCYGLCFWIYENTNFIRIDICQVAVLGWRVRLGCKPFLQTRIKWIHGPPREFQNSADRGTVRSYADQLWSVDPYLLQRLWTGIFSRIHRWKMWNWTVFSLVKKFPTSNFPTQ